MRSPLSWLLSLFWRPRRGLLALGVLSLALAVAAIVLQHVLELHPCPLCIFQRLLFFLFGLIALIGAAWPKEGRVHRACGWILALVSLFGCGVGIYQSLMQARPDLVPECSFSDPGPIERFVDWLGMLALSSPPPLTEPLSDLFLATGLCGSREWVFLGLSMANWSALSFLFFAVCAFCLARSTTRPRTP